MFDLNDAVVLERWLWGALVWMAFAGTVLFWVAARVLCLMCL